MSKHAFLVGCWRSGTTWLWRSIAQHPAVLGVPESHVFAYEPGVPDANTIGLLSQQHLWQLVNKFATPEEIDAVVERAKKGEDPRPRGTERAFLAAIAGERRERILEWQKGLAGQTSWDRAAVEFLRILEGTRPWILEKTPHHVMALPRIKRLLPEARIIGIVRDLRDVYASVAAFDKPWTRQFRDPREVATYWAGTCKALLEARSRWPDDVLLLRYEDLIPQFDACLMQIYRFLGVEADAALVARIREDNSFESYTGRERGEGVQGWFYRRGTAGGFTDDLSSEQIAALELHAGPALELFGYELVGAGAS